MSLQHVGLDLLCSLVNCLGRLGVLVSLSSERVGGNLVVLAAGLPVLAKSCAQRVQKVVGG